MSMTNDTLVELLETAPDCDETANDAKNQGLSDIVHRAGFITYKRDGVGFVFLDHRHAQEMCNILFRKEPTYKDSQIAVDALLAGIAKIEQYVSSPNRRQPVLMALYQYLERERVLRDPRTMQRIRGHQLVAFQELDLAFQPGDEVWVARGTPFAGELVKIEHREGFGGPYAELTLAVISVGGRGEPALRYTAVFIPAFDGMRNLQELGVAPLPAAVKAEFAARGSLLPKYALSSTFAQYTGELLVPGWFGDRCFRGDGRVVIDNQSLSYLDPDQARGLQHPLNDRSDAGGWRLRGEEDQGAAHKAELSPDDYWRVWPYVPAFSFRLKRWGKILLSGLTDIDYRDDAFDLLVMDSEIKHVIYSLVKHSGNAFTDLIDGKSGGCIFLLHGEPGVGKTLTAEAVAEVLHRPLYTVSVGELGTEPDHLEDALRRVLEMATRWNAVLLLDEADIFLEARTEHDIHRNAMVGVFLRLLEYHSGVLFLTTNRVKNFDPAFHSRISLALHYPPLNETTREQVIKNLFGKAGVAVPTNGLAEQPLNGRQIKNALRIAQTLAQSEGRELTHEDLERVVALTTQFQQYLDAQH